MNVFAPKGALNTRAVVIMYGWVNAPAPHLKKYADLYARHAAHPCAAVCGTLDTATAMVTQSDARKAAMVRDSVRRAATLVRDAEKGSGQEVPVVLHYFSNGGAFVARKLDAMIKDVSEKGANAGHSNDQDAQDLELVRQRLRKGFEVVDSAPCYIHQSTRNDVIDAAIPSLSFRLILKSLVYISDVMKKANNYMSSNEEETPEQKFWRDMIQSDLCPRQAFVYSTRDRLTDPAKLDEFVARRRERGVEATALRFDDSDHVLHLRKHPAEYGELVDRVLERACGSDGKDRCRL